MKKQNTKNRKKLYISKIVKHSFILQGSGCCNIGARCDRSGCLT